MKQTTNTTTTYKINKKWYLDVVETADSFEAYIYTEHSGFKMFTIGVAKHQKLYDGTEYDEKPETVIEWTLDDLKEYQKDFINMTEALEEWSYNRINWNSGFNTTGGK